MKVLLLGFLAIIIVFIAYNTGYEYGHAVGWLNGFKAHDIATEAGKAMWTEAEHE